MNDHSPQPYDYTRFESVKEIDVTAEGYDAIEMDGVYRLTGSNITVDYLLRDVQKARELGTVLVCFSGAIKTREGKTGPFFSGAGLHIRSGLPLISISDPTLALSDDLCLSWYMGDRDTVHLPQTIAAHLDGIAAHLGVQLVMAGGSGGGFAILNVQQHMRHPARSFVWNPQTDVSRYINRHVQTYLDAADRRGVVISNFAEASVALVETGVSHVVTESNAGTGEIIYFQNAADNHVTGHLLPFMKGSEWTETLPGVFSCSHRRMTVALASWGEGHAGMPKDTVADTIRSVASTQSTVEIAAAVQQVHPLKDDNVLLAIRSALG